MRFNCDLQEALVAWELDTEWPSQQPLPLLQHLCAMFTAAYALTCSADKPLDIAVTKKSAPAKLAESLQESARASPSKPVLALYVYIYVDYMA